MRPASTPDLGSGVLARPFESGDLDAVVVAFADPAIVQWSPGPLDFAADPATAARDWLARRTGPEAGDDFSWALVDDSGSLLGTVSVHKVNLAHGNAEIGYWVVPAARGKGLATRAVTAAAGWAFGTLGLHRLSLMHAVDNLASCRVATAAGFALEGELRESFVYGDGLRHNEHLHARLVHDG